MQTVISEPRVCRFTIAQGGPVPVGCGEKEGTVKARHMCRLQDGGCSPDFEAQTRTGIG